MRLSARTTAYPTKWSDYTTLWKPTIHKCAQNLKNVLRVLLGKKRDYKKTCLVPGLRNFINVLILPVGVKV